MPMPLSHQDILLVENDEDIAELISIYLRNQAFTTRVAGTLQEASRQLAQQTPDLIICDIMLPDGEGTAWVQTVKANSQFPVIFLSSRKEPEDIILGLELGGDDYITKPFDPDIMVARVKARLRRAAPLASTVEAKESVWSDDRLTFNFNNWEVRLNGEALSLPAKELQLLFYMASHPGQVFSVEQLYDQIWGINSWSDTRTVILRRKIEDDPSNHHYIATVRGIGYKFQR